MPGRDPIIGEIERERLALADLVDSMSAEELATASLCGEWTVHQVAGHLLMPLITSTRTVAAALLRAGGNFDRANDRMTRAVASRPATDIAAALRAQARNRFHPPIFGLEAPMAELVLHGQDLRRPVGLPVAFGEPALRRTLEHLASPRARVGFVPRGRLAGLRFEATDLDWTFGDGATVRGPAASIAYAMSGRAASLPELDGPGVAVLAGR
jgi:uncharacterized protein (TIGR03083 family)